MAKSTKSNAVHADGNAPSSSSAKTSAKKPRGPRGVKLALPPAIQKQLSDLPDLYPKLKQSDVQGRFMDLLSPSLDSAYQSAFDQLVNDLESERTAKVQALRGIVPPANVAPDYDDPNYVALDDATAQ
jgi:hypothetical protein